MTAPPTSKGVILIVEDSATNAAVLRNALARHGFHSILARDGETALDLAAHAQPDIILLDVMMPGMNGYEACRHLKKKPATQDIPVIFMTSLSETMDKVKGFQVGAVDYLTKPVQEEEAFARINTHLTLRRLQKDLAAKNAQLSRVNSSRDRFFSVLAQDLKSPLLVMIESSSMLRENLYDLSIRQLADMVRSQHEAAEAMYRLLENMLEWSKIQIGSDGFSPAPINLAPIAARAVATFETALQNKGQTLRNTIPAELPAYADERMMEAVLRNLVSNAVKFTPLNGQIEITAVADEQFATLQIADNGVGLAPEDQARLFSLDTRFSTPGTAGEKGSGLGLVLCREFLDKQGGQIAVASEPGRGSRFAIRLPARRLG